MENITKGAVVLKSAPTAVDMGLINAQSIRELKAEEVFLFRIAACDNQVDRDFECFSDAALEALSKLFVGRTVLSDHRWSSSGQMARVYAAAVEKESGVSRLIRESSRMPCTLLAIIVNIASSGPLILRPFCHILSLSGWMTARGSLASMTPVLCCFAPSPL